MIDRFQIKLRWNDESSEQLDFLDIGIGLSQVSDVAASAKVREFTAIGSAVNLAAAFERDARHGKHRNHLTYRAVRTGSKSNAGRLSTEEGRTTLGVQHKRYVETTSESAEQQIFVSHSHSDRQAVEAQLVQPLNALGIKTWYSTDDIAKGAFWPAEIRKALSQCTWMVVVVSKYSAGSEWVRLEVDLAMGMGHMKGKIVPVQLTTRRSPSQ
jgi:hypothetical protein